MRVFVSVAFIVFITCFSVPLRAAEKEGEENVFAFGKGTVRIEGSYSAYFVNRKFFRVEGKGSTVWYVKGQVAIEVTTGERSREHLSVPSFENMVVTFGKEVKVEVDGEDIFKERKKEVTSAGEFVKKKKRFNSANIKSVVVEGLFQPLVVTRSKRRTVLVIRLEGFPEDMASVGTGQDGRCLTVTAQEGFQPRITLVAPEKTALTFRNCSGGNVTSNIAAVYVHADDMGEYTASQVDNANIYISGEVQTKICAKGQLVVDASGESVCDATFGTSAQVSASGNAVVTLGAPNKGSPRASISTTDSAVVRVSRAVDVKDVHKAGNGTVERVP